MSLINAVAPHVQRIAIHSYGCRVVQRLLEQCEQDQLSSVLDGIVAGLPNLIINKFGNYVVQHTLLYCVRVNG